MVGGRKVAEDPAPPPLLSDGKGAVGLVEPDGLRRGCLGGGGGGSMLPPLGGRGGGGLPANSPAPTLKPVGNGPATFDGRFLFLPGAGGGGIRPFCPLDLCPPPSSLTPLGTCPPAAAPGA